MDPVNYGVTVFYYMELFDGVLTVPREYRYVTYDAMCLVSPKNGSQMKGWPQGLSKRAA